MTLDFSIFALIYIAVGMGLLFGLWLFYDFRDKGLYEAERQRTVFHCVKCGELYARQGRVDVAACPCCGFENSKLSY